MSIFSKIFGRKKDNEAQEQVQVGGMEDFMTLIRVYYQSVMASQLGISNINFLPDMATFKRSLKIPTQNNKLGIAENRDAKDADRTVWHQRSFLQRNRRVNQKEL